MATTTFNDKVVIVTGGNSGIGAAIVAQFLQARAKVAVLDIRPPENPEVVANSQRQDIACDVGNEKAVESSFNQVLAKFGTVDILCNVAGIMDAMARPGETTTESWHRCFRVNVDGPFYLTRLAVQHFLTKPSTTPTNPDPTTPANPFTSPPTPSRGTIINICSTASQSGAHAGTAYTASKHALLGLSRNTAWMYAKDGIRCNAVLPGGVLTNISANSGVDVQALRESRGMAALGVVQAAMPGVADAGDVAGVVLMLAGNESVNGAEVCVDRGWSVV